MNARSEIIYERDNPNEPALVVKVDNLDDLNHPKIQSTVEKLGLTIKELQKLLKLDFTPLDGPTPESPIYNNKGDKIEDAVTRFVNTPVGNVEVADCKLYKEVVTGLDDQSLHLKVGKTGGFEVIYALEGNAVLDFPENVEPVASGLYVASKERAKIKLEPGVLALIPAPTANAWSIVGDGFKFRYVCQPAWSPDFVKPALDQ